MFNYNDNNDNTAILTKNQSDRICKNPQYYVKITISLHFAVNIINYQYVKGAKNQFWPIKCGQSEMKTQRVTDLIAFLWRIFEIDNDKKTGVIASEWKERRKLTF